jgi:hypothetical protein
MDNVTVRYRNPHPLDNCEEFTTRTIFGLRQAYGSSSIIATANKTACKLIGPVTIPVLVLDGQTNQTGRAVSQVQHHLNLHSSMCTCCGCVGGRQLGEQKALHNQQHTLPLFAVSS